MIDEKAFDFAVIGLTPQQKELFRIVVGNYESARPAMGDDVVVCGLNAAEIARLKNWFSNKSGKSISEFWEEAFNAGVEAAIAAIPAGAPLGKYRCQTCEGNGCPDCNKTGYAPCRRVSAPAPADEAWQLIETAPKDGTNILLWWPKQFHCALTGHWADKWNPWIGWKVSGWSHDLFKTEPTHWMPLPKPPAALNQQKPEGK